MFDTHYWQVTVDASFSVIPKAVPDWLAHAEAAGCLATTGLGAAGVVNGAALAVLTAFGGGGEAGFGVTTCFGTTGGSLTGAFAAGMLAFAGVLAFAAVLLGGGVIDKAFGTTGFDGLGVAEGATGWLCVCFCTQISHMGICSTSSNSQSSKPASSRCSWANFGNKGCFRIFSNMASISSSVFWTNSAIIASSSWRVS